MTQSRQMKLGAFVHPAGHHVASWRLPDAPVDATTNFKQRIAFAKAVEAAKFDMLFLADTVAAQAAEPDVLSRVDKWAIGFEPLTLISALAAVTEKIGLVATVSTTFNEPYNLARRFASLDLISGGRAGWNLVTSSSPLEFANFGEYNRLSHHDRYARATEFLDVVLGLWNSWDDDAFVRDKASGLYFEPDRLHILNHNGAQFHVRGPLTVPRSAQGHPVVIQAGSSDAGMELAARSAEVVFTAQPTLKEAQAFYGDLKSRLAKYGRSTNELLVMPGVFPIVGRTESEAREKFDALQELIHPTVGLHFLSRLVGEMNLADYPLDGPLPEIPETEGNKSRQNLIIAWARREGLSIRQTYEAVAGARGHWQIVGTAAQIADELEAYFTQGGADGFNVMPPTVPAGLNDFIELVVPELRRRGLFRHEYEGATLRENLGLRRPPDLAHQAQAHAQTQAAE